MKLAIFDFDGTLSKWYAWIAFIDYLHERGMYPGALYKKQMQLVEEHKQGRLSYDKWADECGDLWTKAFVGVPFSKLSSSASLFFRGFKRNIYGSSYKLVDFVKNSGFTPIIVTVDVYEVMRLVAKELGIEKLYATRLETKRGICTGKSSNLLYRTGGKLKIIKMLSKRYGLTGSIGFGDSMGDRDLLESVELPVALNPSSELRELAKSRKWLVADKLNVVRLVQKELRQKSA